MRGRLYALFHAVLLVLLMALFSGFLWHGQTGLAGGNVVLENKVPTPCDPWKDSCPGGSLYCFTLGPLTCYCNESPCLTD